jgi:hypothetical protein
MNEQHIESAWWSVDIPADWTADEDADCFTFESPDQSVALQFSAARKDGGHISDDDLRDLAREHLDAGARLANVSFGSFTGFSIAFRADGMDHRHWWLRHDSLMVFITLTAPESTLSQHEPTARQILQSLQPTGNA